MSYTKNKCGANGPLLLQKVDGTTTWKRWAVAVTKKENSKSWLVQLKSAYDPKGKKPTCLGKIALSKPDLCQAGKGVADALAPIPPK